MIQINETVHYPMEFLNSANPPNLLSHILLLKVGTQSCYIGAACDVSVQLARLRLPCDVVAWCKTDQASIYTCTYITVSSRHQWHSIRSLTVITCNTIRLKDSRHIGNSKAPPDNFNVGGIGGRLALRWHERPSWPGWPTHYIDNYEAHLFST